MANWLGRTGKVLFVRYLRVEKLKGNYMRQSVSYKKEKLYIFVNIWRKPLYSKI